MMDCDFLCIDEVKKGWSGDRKFYAVTRDGKRFLLRVTRTEGDVSTLYTAKRHEFDMMVKVADLGVPVCTPYRIWHCERYVYSLQRWVDGGDASDIVPTLPPKEQYKLGVKAGEHLRAIHSLPAPSDAPDWSERFTAKIDRSLKLYSSCGRTFDGAEQMKRYITDNRHLLHGRPQTYQHGDYHIGNMMIDSDGTLTVIDFNRHDHGDPWEEFNRIVWSAQDSPEFATGTVDGYFADTVPDEFWRLLLLYICRNSLTHIPWAIAFGEEEVRVGLAQIADIMRWYDGLRTVVPSWYKAVRD